MKKLLDIPKETVAELTKEAKEKRTQFKPYAELVLINKGAELASRNTRRKLHEKKNN